MTVNHASCSPSCNMNYQYLSKKTSKNLVFLRQFNFYLLSECRIILSEFNLEITSWKEDSQGVEEHWTKTPHSLFRLLHKSAGIFRQTECDPAGQGVAVFPGFVSKQSGGVTDFLLFSQEQISWPQVEVIIWTGEQTATNPSTTFPLHVPWHEMGCWEPFISSLISCTELCKTISKVWPAVEGIPWLSCTSQQAACSNSDVKTITILGNPAALTKYSTKSCSFQCEKYSKTWFLQLVPFSPPTHIHLTETNHEGHFFSDFNLLSSRRI